MRALAFAALLFAAASPASANLLINGSFEADPAADGSFIIYNGGDSFTGWNVVGGQLLVIENDYLEDTIRTNAFDGQNSLDLTGFGSGSPTTGVSQTIATIIGATYNVRFAVGNLNSSGSSASLFNGPTTVDLSIDGGARTAFTHDGITQNLIDYRVFTTSFVATGTSTNLTFFRGLEADSHVALDDISVTAAIPEPASWALLITGFGLVGAALRRRVLA